MAKRKGRQTPTVSVVKPFKKSLGKEAAAIYNETGRTAQKWQENILKNMMAVTPGGLWRHTKYGYSLPRRNGKNECLIMRELWGLEHGEHILHTAHRTTTTHAAWERLLDAAGRAGLEVVSSYRAFGKEHIEVDGGGKIEFRTRTSTGGLGEGFDLLVIDEAQEYKDDQESTLKYVVSDSKNPQTILTGTPPTPISGGTVFMKFRADTMTGGGANAAWEEWSVERETDPHDKDAWYETNPSLGTVLTERVILDEIGGDRTDFNIQRLGLWLRYNQKSAISREEWKALRADGLPALKGSLFAGVKYGVDGERVSLSVAVKTADERVFIEGVDCRPVRAGNQWIIDFLRRAEGVKAVAVDGAGAQNILAAEMKDAGIKKAPVLPTVKQVITANAKFEQAMFQKTLCHAGQPSMEEAASNCEKRPIGANGGFGYRSIMEGVEIGLLDSAILAHWLAAEDKERAVKQRVMY